MRKHEIEVGQRLALCSTGYDRTEFRGVEVEVIELGVGGTRGYGYSVRSVRGTRVRRVRDGHESVVPNVELWMPWDEYVPLKAEHAEVLAEKQARRAEFKRVQDLENAEIVKALDVIDFEHDGRFFDPNKNHDALLALARAVNG